LSQGALVGIIVGVVGTFVVTASVGFFLWTWRKYRGQPPTNSGRSGGCCGLFTRREVQQQPPDPFAAHAVPLEGISMSHQDVKRGPPGMYELDGVWYRVEMAEGNGKFELDGTSRFDRDFDRVKKLVVPEGLGGPSPQKTGYPEIYATTPATSATEISEQKVRVQDL
jgi:hypothetical protein